MRVPTARQRPAKAQVTSFAAPTGGLVSNRNLAVARGADVPPGAAVLENMFPTATGVSLRRGSARWASVVEDAPVKALFTYSVGTQRELFAATDAGIWDITVVPSPYSWVLATEDDDYIATDVAEQVFGEDSLEGLDILATTGGDWVVTQFATAGGDYLIGVNGVDAGFIYDGTTFYPSVAGGVWGLAYDTETGAFTAGETLTGGTSSATATILKVIDNGTTGLLWLTDVDGTFENDETITDSETGSAAAQGTATLLAPGVEFPDGVSLTTADLSYVWVYRQRLWFIEKNTLNAWYLDVDQVGGELTLWPMGGIFVRGGTLLWGQAWSLDGGDAGGLSEQCVFTTTEGEVAAYQGLSPDPDQGWTKVGVYRIGKPLGKKALIRAGGDLVVATTVGFISLAKAASSDYAALGLGAVSYPIEVDWARAVQDRGQVDWRCQVWAEGRMVLVAPPTPVGLQPMVLVANANTGKWAIFTGWDVTALEVFNGALFFGSSNGAIRRGWTGGSDEGLPYVGKMLPLFDGLDAPASMKVAKTARAVARSAVPAKVQLSGHRNFRPDFPAPPSQSSVPTGNEWDNAIWDTSIWDAEGSEIVTGDWVSVGAYGHDIAIGAQITSGSPVPVDLELIRIDLTYTTAMAGT